MSSTNRKGSREPNDYYRTPVQDIQDFIIAFNNETGAFDRNDLKILDPCAGGDTFNPMSYPEALSRMNISLSDLTTIDIREDSKADIKGDFLTLEQSEGFDIIISNPPFKKAQEFIEHSLNHVNENGFVIMLLRLNFFESKGRKPFFERHMPKYAFVHHARMSFTEDGKTDSVAYMHCVWQKGHYPDYTELRII